MVKLNTLLRQVPNIQNEDIPSLEITGISFDSRQVRPGNIFIALEGGSFDGHAYIPQAVEGGAVAVIGRKPLDLHGVPYFQVPNPRETLAYVSAAFYDFPARQMTVIGVTGTDGKTTTVNLLYNMLLAAGLPAGMISTVNAVIGNEEIDTGFHVTTPEAPTIQRLLRKMVDSGITHVVLETTSHGLAQHRATACDFDIAVITNITHEHLDYHGDYGAYLQAKARLLTGLVDTPKKNGRSYEVAVLNRDDMSYAPLTAILDDPRYAQIKRVTYGTTPDCDLYGRDLATDTNGISFTLETQRQTQTVTSSLMGAYNMHNIMAAAAAASLGLGLDLALALQGVNRLAGVPGRMEKIDLGQDFLAIVDFAHTPNALKVALETANRMKGQGRVIAVFGSAGLRDREKRRMMAATSLALADITILTAEDPRTESLEEILAEMADEAVKSGGVEEKTFLRVPDRGEAIRKAVRLAQPGDIVIACGKGHEQSMCFGQTEYPWDDRTAMRAALSEHLGLPGPAMPYLPTQDR
ncbi:UDP-N-acetylmuramoyl-L-alanyl-D-glutamate--2,6-diaminopimelate ligase [Pelolinea submarina]|uniref:UDP-N-acetylmuramyl-tripeptide synthetase n=1 Tax=Pelolinea submarina TaxID=913107 RepID=A0A347ZV98_9CHLR|nr:UDP-N-acetylmuramoyl-L-alanyl-D-glutamate--2,6-diaminopimelate ligase [Pelolinea submarina]REG10185.1 UDP-N-acetylmuramoylalanyl-D-glutamate--2,6-diaminopimelate ligase [Pelolinea submarina]BBB49229.1 UDP-N-acetylmuramoyl-L-alanyl-D-glutamate--2,6-diaminopimelate ligase [Pelolinea submarina]